MNRRFKPVIVLALGFLGFIWSLCSAHAASLVLDQDFRPPLFAEPFPAQRVLLLPDGKFLLFFNTNTLTDQSTGAITRYNPDGSLDTSFSFSKDYSDVTAVALTANSQLIIAARQNTYSIGFGSEQILRLNSDGSVDPTFNTQIVHPESYTTVRSIVIQPDGRILVGGSFDNFAGAGLPKIARLLSDGTLDPSFTPPQFSGGFYGVYAKPLLVPNDKIVIGGDFSQVNGAPNPGIAQLNSDGSLDPTFQASGFVRINSTTPIRSLVLSNGKILMAGRFRIGTGSTAPRMPLLQLNADGTIDANYAYSTALGQNAYARDVILQPDGKAIATITNDNFGSAYRFEVTGPPDPGFMPPFFVDTTYYAPGEVGTPITVNLQPDGRIIVGGTFTDANPSPTPDGSHFGVVRLNSDGSVDPSLVTTHRTGIQDSPTSFARLDDGSALVTFQIQSTRHDPQMVFNLGRLLPNGGLDANFTLSSSDPSGILSMEFVAADLVKLSDGEFLILDHYGLAGKFFPNGVQDLGFQFTPGSPFQRAATGPNGNVILSAGTDSQSTVFGPLGRIRRDGSVDSSFSYSSFIGSVYAGQVIYDQGYLYQLYLGSHVLAVQPDGKFLYVYFLEDNLFHFVRLNDDGSIDNGFSGLTLNPINLTVDYPVVFDPYSGGLVQPLGGAWSATCPLQDAHILSDGRILLCGEFTSYNGVPARGIVRLLPDGTVDDTFSIGGGAQWTQTVETPSFFPFVETMEEQVDGNLLIAGTFEAFSGTPLPGIASLYPDGSVDPSFIPPAERRKSASGNAKLARQSDGSFLLSGPYSFPGESNPTFIHINNIGGIPVIGSPPTATALVGQPFSYQIIASGQPTSYGATGLPPGFYFDPQTGVISGAATSDIIGIYTILLTATNDEGISDTFYLTLSIVPSQIGPLPSLRNISTRLKVLSGDNTLIGGFIITGGPPIGVIIRAIGPSLTDLGVPGALADPVLELHGPGSFVTITNDNWRDTQENEIKATGIPPSNDLESAIVATLPPGAYTAIVRGKDDGTGVGLVEAYDLESTIYAQLANISTRGFVDRDENVMIGGLIAGPTSAGSGRALVRAIGPSLSNFGVPNAIQDPILELHNGNGDLIASNNDWRDTQEVAIQATGIAPTDDHEAAILSVLSPGSYTAIVRGADNGTGVGLVEVYNLQ